MGQKQGSANSWKHWSAPAGGHSNEVNRGSNSWLESLGAPGESGPRTLDALPPRDKSLDAPLLVRWASRMQAPQGGDLSGSPCLAQNLVFNNYC